MNYLSIGTNKLNKDLFLDVRNTGTAKPLGGIWATEQEYPTYNAWVDYLCDHPHLLFYKNYGYPNLAAVYLTLQEDARICSLNTEDDIKCLKEKYPLNDWINFEKLSKDYDGIFINYQKLIDNSQIKPYSVNTLILFNLNCVKYYQVATVVIDSLDIDNPTEMYEYRIEISEEKIKIPEESLKYSELFQKAKEYLIKHNTGQKEEVIEQFLKEHIEVNELPCKDLITRKLIMSI